MNLLVNLGRDVFKLLYPSVCASCAASLIGNEDQLCLSCWNALPKTNFHHQKDNPVEQKFWGRVKIQHATSFYYFNKESRLQDVLHALKYGGKQKLGIELGRAMGLELSVLPWIKEIDYIIPVPLSNQKLKSRGYNQSECLALGLAVKMKIPIDSTSLQRVKHTKSQTTMSIADRQQNVQNAFALQNELKFVNKHVLLIDDVLTTGATLEACALAFKKVQDAQISILTLAYAIE